MHRFWCPCQVPKGANRSSWVGRRREQGWGAGQPQPGPARPRDQVGGEEEIMFRAGQLIDILWDESSGNTDTSTCREGEVAAFVWDGSKLVPTDARTLAKRSGFVDHLVVSTFLGWSCDCSLVNAKRKCQFEIWPNQLVSWNISPGASDCHKISKRQYYNS